jgi:hypothetical protein
MIIVTIALLAALCTISIGANQTINAQEEQFNITTTQGGGTADIKVSLNPGEGNVTVITPNNSTTLENVTAEPIANDTGIIVVPENTTVTEVDNQTTVVVTPEPPCGCPVANETGPEEGALAPVIVTPAPGQEVITENGTELVANESQEEPIPVPPQEPEPAPVEPETGGGGNDTIVITPAPAPEEGGGGSGGGNDTGSNETGGGNGGGNITGASSSMQFLPFIPT